MMATTQPTIRSSLPLELLLFLNLPFSILFYVFTLGMFIYKIALFPYSLHVAICEAAILLLFGPIEIIRIYWARRGNLTIAPALLALSLLLSAGSASTCIYQILFQAYVGLVERTAAYVELGMLTVEALLTVSAILAFRK